jgi:putative heme-binding domain-containing protein
MPRCQSAARNSLPALALLILAGLSTGVAPARAQDDPFAAGVRPTPWLKPEEEQKLFKLPEGFEIQLVAAEPDIQKPLNMAFDEKGRIWLTCTVEYPYAAPLDRPGRDSIRVLEDTDGDGRFEKVTVFADGLNIPIGIYPWKGGCVAYSIPDITHFEDTDGDGKCDKRTKRYGPFDYSRDTHGMVNSFRRGFDGWVYACHGFNNDSHVKGADGHEVHLNSGNTFRFQLDGSRIEQFTHGQVNPFGMCMDDLFNIFTADCHSKPIYQLIRGGYYPSFGKPHDGLGFVPPMMDHLHGSTAICGLAIYTGENFPKEYRGQFFSGNVMTSRINRNKPEYQGSTIKAVEQPDFLIAGDPWFRPVDIHIGPDGAMYVLDFYNRIIGHYEVPLPHPGRDRTSGRIWRIVYKGDGPETKPAGKPAEIDLTKMSVPELVKQLEHPNLEHRLRILNFLVDVKTIAAAPEMQSLDQTDALHQKTARLWFQARTGTLDETTTKRFLDSDRQVRVHLMKVAGKRPLPLFPGINVASHGVDDPDPFVASAAALSSDGIKGAQFVHRLLNRIDSSAGDDLLLRQALRMACRNTMVTREGRGVQPVPLELKDFGNEHQRELMTICLAVPTTEAARLLTEYVATCDEPREQLMAYVQQASKHSDQDNVSHLMGVIQQRFEADVELQSGLLASIASGLSQRGWDLPSELDSWGEELASRLLALDRGDLIPWTAVPIDGLPPSENPWVLQQRVSADGDNESMFFCSIVKGEPRTGIYRSAAFELPEKLSFWCAGHDGFPTVKLQGKNLVRLRDAKTHEVLSGSPPPRNDTAQKIEWDLAKLAGKQGYVELVDGDPAGAYAWLAVGRFSIAGLNPSKRTEHLIAAADIVGKLKLQALRPQLAELLVAANTDGAGRTAIGQALVALDPDSRATALVAALGDPAIGDALRAKISPAIAGRDSKLMSQSLQESMKVLPLRMQTTLAETLAGDATGAQSLIGMVQAGVASPRLLTSVNVKAKLDALKNDKLSEQVAAITANLPAQNEVIDKLVVERRAAYARAKPSLEKGQALFEKHCAACHQIAGKGSVIGPQLDGIGLRGLERLVEDVLDPNRNVDVAFRTTTIRTVNGEVISGLVRREEGATLVLADNKGKEFSIPKGDIDEQAKGSLSLMPANVHEIVSEVEFYDLLAYLLSQKQAKEPAK